VDPAMGEYFPSPGQEVGDLPGIGGIYNYVNMHVYHYGGNNPIKYVDPNGREMGMPSDVERILVEREQTQGKEFETIEQAAIDFAITYNDDSIRQNREFGASIYQLDNGSYTYSIPRRGGMRGVRVSSPPRGYRAVATIHTHGAHVPSLDSENFSIGDKNRARRRNIPSYLVTPSGALKVFDPTRSTGRLEYVIENQNIPSDPNARRRLTTVDPGDGRDDPFIK
jgi:hypothetical protein